MGAEALGFCAAGATELAVGFRNGADRCDGAVGGARLMLGVAGRPARTVGPRGGFLTTDTRVIRTGFVTGGGVGGWLGVDGRSDDAADARVPEDAGRRTRATRLATENAREATDETTEANREG